MHSGAALLALGVLLAVACGRVQDDDSSAGDCRNAHCPAQGVVGGAKATGGGGASNGGAQADEGGVSGGGSLNGPGEGGTFGPGDAGDAGNAGALPTDSRAWGMEQSVTHEQMDSAEANGAMALAVAGDDSAFTIWKSNVAGWPVYASRYAAGDAWSQPYPLDAESGVRDSEVAIAAEHNGDAIAAWLRVTAAGSEVRAARYHAGWQPSLVISALPYDIAPGLQIVSNPSGDYFVVWAQASVADGAAIAQVAHYVHDQDWQTLRALSYLAEGDPNTVVSLGQVAVSINPKGDALFSGVAPSSAAAQSVDLIAQRYLAEGGFQARETLARGLTGSASGAGQALDDAGRAVVVWAQGDFPSTQIRSSTFSSTWGAPLDLGTNDPASRAGGPLVAGDSAGHFVAVWVESKNNLLNVFGSSMQAGGAWSTPMPLDPDLGLSGSAYSPVLSMSRSGTALVAWQHGLTTGGETNSLYATSFRFESGFAAPTVVSDGQVRDYLSVVSDPEGNGMLLWRFGRAAGMPLLQAARYRPRLGWQLPVLDVASEARIFAIKINKNRNIANANTTHHQARRCTNTD